jgi:hypothetical protein
MFFRGFVAATVLAVLCGSAALVAEPSFKVLAFYSTDVEGDHVKTANDAIAFYRDLAAKNNFVFDLTTDWNKLDDNALKPYKLSWSFGSTTSHRPRSSALRSNTTWNTVAAGSVSTLLDTTTRTRAGPGSWIFSEARFFTPTTGRRFPQN